MSKRIKGFTLVELLVVIAIIGILTAIVLISLGGATDRAKDARITADLSQVRSKAVLFYADKTSYASTCAGDTLDDSDTELKTIENDIMAQLGSTATTTDTRCYTTTAGNAYCAAARLITTGKGWFCVDSTGAAGSGYASSSCDSGTADCAVD